MTRHIEHLSGHMSATTIRLVKASAAKRGLHIEIVRLTGSCVCGYGCGNRGRHCYKARSTLINAAHDGDTSLTWGQVLAVLPPSVVERINANDRSQ